MILAANSHTRWVPTEEGIFTVPVLLLAAVIVPKAPEEAVALRLARLV
jgi:hypothetical protein